MGIPTFDVDMNIVSKIPEYPSDGGFNTETFRAEFDKAGLLLQKYINSVLIPELNKTVDVEALLADILDSSLAAADKAAPAKVVGDKLKELSASGKTLLAKLFAHAVESGAYIVQADQNLAATLITVNKARVSGGAYVTQGNYIELNIGSYAEVAIDDGAVGIFRNDLICARCVRDSEGVEANSIILLKGSQELTEGVDPEYTTGNLNAGGAVTHDTPLYRVRLSGLDVTLEPLLAVQDPLAERHTSVAITLPADGWVDNQQQIDVAGVTADPLKTDVTVSPDPADENYAAFNECGVRAIKQLDGAVIFKCEDVPSIDLAVSVAVDK